MEEDPHGCPKEMCIRDSIYNGLKVRILGSIDLKAAGIEEVCGLAFRIS